MVDTGAEAAPKTDDVLVPAVAEPDAPVIVAEADAAPVKKKPGRPKKIIAVATAPIPVIAAAPALKPAAKPAPVKKPAAAPVKTYSATKTKQPAAAAAIRSASAPTKDKTIMTTTDYTEKFQSAFKDASDKAKAAMEKSQSQFGELGAFTKGNVEALVEASKIFTSGFQELSKAYLADGKTAVETLTAEIKDLTAVKSPTELLEKQSALLRKQFDAVVAASSKNSEAVLKLANEAFQPISNRVSLAVEKIKHAA